MPANAKMILPALYALVMVAPAGADPLPASVRACIGEADAGRRLACYDREVARLIAPADTFAPTTATAPPAALPPHPSAAAAPAAATAAAPPAAPPQALSAKVTAVHQAGDNLIVTLDNGDVWEQSSPATSQLNLRPGDAVKVDREMGAWFLSNRYGETIQVRLRQP